MARPLKSFLRGDTYYLRKGVPKRYRRAEERAKVWVSLETDSYSEAEAKIRGVWDQTLAGWEAKRAGDTADAESRFAAARELDEGPGLPLPAPAPRRRALDGRTRRAGEGRPTRISPPSRRS